MKNSKESEPKLECDDLSQGVCIYELNNCELEYVSGGASGSHDNGNR